MCAGRWRWRTHSLLAPTPSRWVKWPLTAPGRASRSCMISAGGGCSKLTGNELHHLLCVQVYLAQVANAVRLARTAEVSRCAILFAQHAQHRPAGSQ